MNLGSVNVALRERGLLETLDLTVPFVRELGRGLYLRLAAVLLVPTWVALVLLHYEFEVGWVWVWLIALVSASLLEGAFTIAAGQLMFSPAARLRDVLALFVKSVVSLALWLSISRIFILLSSFTLIFPVILWSRHQFIHEVVVLEGVRGPRALDRSRRIASEGAAPGSALGFWLFFAQAFMVMGSEFVCQALVEGVLELGEPFGTLWQGGSPYALLGLLASVPLVASARFLAYVDQRTRTDAWDVQVRFLEIRAASGSAA